MSSKDKSAEYYILDTRVRVGECLVFWMPNGAGYTCNVDQAGLFTLADALSHRDTDVAVHKSVVGAVATRRVHMDAVLVGVARPEAK